MEFFNGFNFDTLLALISCFVSIISLFISKDVYEKYKEANKLIVKKTLKDDSEDHSINVAGTYNAGIKKEELEIVVDKMSTLNKENFSETLDKAYTMFQMKCDDNLHKIIDETNKIIEERKITLAGYTKLDWIHVYFEAAKNTSDTYMQNVWAKVLAKEISQENSISYKTIYTLKNMSANEFKMFEKLGALNVNNIICEGDYLKNVGFNWINLQKMREYGMISLDNSKRDFNIKPKDSAVQLINGAYAIDIKNENDIEKSGSIHGYPLTNVALELLNVIDIKVDRDCAKNIANQIQKQLSNFVIGLYEIESTGEFSRMINYNKNILEE